MNGSLGVSSGQLTSEFCVETIFLRIQLATIILHHFHYILCIVSCVHLHLASMCTHNLCGNMNLDRKYVCTPIGMQPYSYKFSKDYGSITLPPLTSMTSFLVCVVSCSCHSPHAELAYHGWLGRGVGGGTGGGIWMWSGSLYWWWCALTKYFCPQSHATHPLAYHKVINFDSYAQFRTVNVGVH